MQYYAIFLRKLGEKTYEKIAQQKIKVIKDDLPDKITSQANKTFIVPKVPSYVEKNKQYFFYDWDSEEIINFIKTDMGIDAEWLDQFLVKNIIGQIILRIRQGLNQSTDKGKIVQFIVAFGFGALVGYVASGF